MCYLQIKILIYVHRWLVNTSSCISHYNLNAVHATYVRTYVHTHTLYMYYTYCTCAIHTLYVYYTYTIHVLYIYYTFTIHVLYMHYTYYTCTISVLYMYYTYVYYTYNYMYNTCTILVLYMYYAAEYTNTCAVSHTRLTVNPTPQQAPQRVQGQGCWQKNTPRATTRAASHPILSQEQHNCPLKLFHWGKETERGTHTDSHGG